MRQYQAGLASVCQKKRLRMGFKSVPTITRDIHYGFKVAAVFQRKTGIPLWRLSFAVEWTQK